MVGWLEVIGTGHSILGQRNRPHMHPGELVLILEIVIQSGVVRMLTEVFWQADLSKLLRSL